MYYHIDPITLTIISGPHDVNSVYIRQLTRCGTPEVLNLLDYQLVPEVRETLGINQRYGTGIVTHDAVTFTTVDKTEIELEGERFVRRQTMICTPRQARLALIQSGLLASVQAAVTQADEVTRIEWEYANEIKREHPAILALAQSLNLTDIQLDTLFDLAMTL